jgi:hypothetical protein
MSDDEPERPGWAAWTLAIVGILVVLVGGYFAVTAINGLATDPTAGLEVETSEAG